MVIAIAATADERARLARALEGVTLLLVASAAEAGALLGLSLRGESLLAVPGPRRPLTAVPTAVPTAPTAPTASPDGPVHLDADRRTATCGEQTVGLSPLEYDLLRCLLTHVGRTWTFARLHREVWGNDHLAARDDVQSVVKRLRSKLTGIDSPLRVQSVRGVGLRLQREGEPPL